MKILPIIISILILIVALLQLPPVKSWLGWDEKNQLSVEELLIADTVEQRKVNFENSYQPTYVEGNQTINNYGDEDKSSQEIEVRTEEILRLRQELQSLNEKITNIKEEEKNQTAPIAYPEPSEEEIRALIKQDERNFNDSKKGIYVAEYHRIEKLGCTPAEKGAGCFCSIRVTSSLTSKDSGINVLLDVITPDTMQEILTVRFVKSQIDGWVISAD